MRTATQARDKGKFATNYPQAAEVLDQIDEVLRQGGREGDALWAVLTALRGPDDGNSHVKAFTTEVIRTTALPRTAAAFDRTIDPIAANFASTDRAFRDDELKGAESHFEDHSRHAAFRLGLIDALW